MRSRAVLFAEQTLIESCTAHQFLCGQKVIFVEVMEAGKRTVQRVATISHKLRFPLGCSELVRCLRHRRNTSFATKIELAVPVVPFMDENDIAKVHNMTVLTYFLVAFGPTQTEQLAPL
jgi:hypothetical protein